MGEIIMRKWDLREFCVRVNEPSPIQRAQVPNRPVITPIRGYPNPIRQVIPLIAYVHSYTPHHSHLHHPSVAFSSTTLQSSQNTKLSHPSATRHVMIISWHWVYHTSSTPSIQDSLSSLHSHDYKLTLECNLSFQRASPCELKGKVTLTHSHGW
jgi:hypothetical protein